MRGKGKESIARRLERLEQLLEINQVRVSYASEPIVEGQEEVVIKLGWIDVPNVEHLENYIVDPKR